MCIRDSGKASAKLFQSRQTLASDRIATGEIKLSRLRLRRHLGGFRRGIALLHGKQQGINFCLRKHVIHCQFLPSHHAPRGVPLLKCRHNTAEVTL